jgi:hypothetical protein
MAPFVCLIFLLVAANAASIIAETKLEQSKNTARYFSKQYLKKGSTT